MVTLANLNLLTDLFITEQICLNMNVTIVAKLALFFYLQE